MAVAIVKGFIVESKCMDCSPRQNKVACVERWPFVEV